ncbi:MAG: HEAT repeat domain-containing protein [Dehalococcoidia bacterium]|nr:HEAT repeat domain-containing protein [Dehalococcoidia bacterium]
MNPQKSDPTPQQKTALAEILPHIADSATPLSNAKISELSDLTAGELKQFEAVWSGMDTERKQQLLSRLSELSDDNVELNFDRIYRNAIYDIDDTVRKEAIEGLWESSDTSLIRPLLRLAQDDPATDVRAAATAALGRFSLLAEHHKISAENRTRISEVLLAVIQKREESLEVRRRALEAVSPISLPDVTRAIWEAYRHEEPEIKISAVYAMGRNCDLLWMPTVLKEMDSDDQEMRYEAATAAGELGEAEAIPQLVELTRDTDTEVKMAAILALGKIGGQEARQRLRVLLSSKSRAVREAAGQAMAELESGEVPLNPHEAGVDEQDTD